MCLEAGLGLGWVGVCESGLVEEQEGARPDRRQPEKHVVDRIWGRAYSSGTQAEDNSLTPSSPPALHKYVHSSHLVPPRPARIPALAYEPQSRGQFRGPTPVVILDSLLHRVLFVGAALANAVTRRAFVVCRGLPVSQVSLVLTLHKAG